MNPPMPWSSQRRVMALSLLICTVLAFLAAGATTTAVANRGQLDTLLDRVGQLDGVHQTQTSIVLSRKIDRRQVG